MYNRLFSRRGGGTGMITLSKTQKANLFDFLQKEAYYERPDYGYHNGGWKIILSREGNNDTPNDFIKAIQLIKREQNKKSKL